MQRVFIAAPIAAVSTAIVLAIMGYSWLAVLAAVFFVAPAIVIGWMAAEAIRSKPKAATTSYPASAKTKKK